MEYLWAVALSVRLAQQTALVRAVSFELKTKRLAFFTGLCNRALQLLRIQTARAARGTPAAVSLDGADRASRIAYLWRHTHADGAQKSCDFDAAQTALAAAQFG